MQPSSTTRERMFLDEPRQGESEEFFTSARWLRMEIPLWLAGLVYVAFAFAVFWPVLLQHRFFWEDFFIQEAPIREFAWYAFGVKHQLPFWNPYSLGFAPLLSDAQNGFWYPTNLLGIALAKLFVPSALHFPLLISEIMTVLHYPLAALGVFVLLRKEFRCSGIAALIAGLTFGFGVRMIAEQNHQMHVYQLALLPWEMLLMMKSWRSYRYTIGFGLLFGISFFAGQPQLFLLIGLFLGSFTLAECILRRHEDQSALRPLLASGIAFIVAAGVAAIQLLPSLELASLSARARLTYAEAGAGALHPRRWVNFVLPKFFGEYPGFRFGVHGVVQRNYWYWESPAYWSLLGEILAIFGLVKALRTRIDRSPFSRYSVFALVLSIFALAYAAGPYLHLQWIFWKFVPYFNKIRTPNRMIYFVWFLGSLYSAAGIDAVLRDTTILQRRKWFFLSAAILFFVLSVLAFSGALDVLFTDTHTVRDGVQQLMLPCVITSAICTGFLTFICFGRPTRSILVLGFALLIGLDLWYNDFTWYRNTLDRNTVTTQDSSFGFVRDFAARYSGTHERLLILTNDSMREMHRNLGMFLRLPIEYAQDTNTLTLVNPMRLSRILPPVSDTTLRMEIMGVTTRAVALSESSYAVTHLPRALPFLGIYSHWITASTPEKESLVMNQQAFDPGKEVVLEKEPSFVSGSSFGGADSVRLASYSENELRFETWSSQRAVVLVNDLYYPAWHAEDEQGRALMVLRADGPLRAVAVPEGHHTVTMYYYDPAFSFGWKFSGIFIAGSLVVLLLPSKKKNPDHKGRGSSTKVR